MINKVSDLASTKVSDPMSSITRVVTGMMLAVCAAAALAVPSGQRPWPVICAANAERVRPVGELKLDVWRIQRGPASKEMSLLGWEQAVQVVNVDTLLPLRKIAEGSKVIQFAVNPAGNRVAWCANTTRVVVQDI